MDKCTTDQVAKAFDSTKFGEVILIIHEGRLVRIDTHIRLVAWSSNNPLDRTTASVKNGD